MNDENIARGHLIRKLKKINQRIVESESKEAELRQVQELLEKERETFFPILHKAPYGIALIDSDGKFIYINPAFINITGYTLEDIFAGRDWFHKASPFPEYRQEIMSSLKRDVIQKGVERIFSVVCKNGEMKEIEFKPTLLDDGRIVVILSDITDHKRAEGALRESEEKYRTILENVEDGYFEVDIAGNLTFFNDSLCRMLGYSRDEMIGMNNRKYTDQENATKLYQAFNRVYRTGEPTKGFGWEVVAKDGMKLFGEVSVSLIKDSKGKPTGFRGIARDITERKRAEEEKAALQEELRQSQKMEAIGSLAGGIAHDFNNLLTVISGNCQLSLLELKEGDPLKGNIEEIKAATDRAASLTRQLLAFSRRQVLDMKVLNLNTIIRDLEKMLRRVIGEDVGLVTSLANDLGTVKTDSGWIEQVIMNLAVNARDAMPSGGKLIIETNNAELEDPYARSHVAMKPGRYVKLCVSDTGLGMAPEVREHLFEPFFTTKKKGKGTGLGLSTVYGIVKQSGGNIWVYSEPGLGTTFNIYLPRVDESLEDIRKKVTREELPGGGETILVVEDEEDVRRLAVRILKRQGYIVLEASCGNDALVLSKERKGPIDMVLTDVVMPGMSGPQLADQLTRLHPKMQVLYMSGYTDNAGFHHGVLKQGVNYIQKPFTIDGLMKKMREVLDKNSIPTV
ncbi:MAG TPA: PAS domain S-box protein [Thermodesulfobacteriota bacterium]|nr:PAS domain S-box protein [Thermodesulfobacteriota bacterium]